MLLCPADDIVSYLRRRRLCFYFRLFVCLLNNRKSCERILMKFLGGYVVRSTGTNEFNFQFNWVQFWWWSRSSSGSRSSQYEIRIHWIIELPTVFDEILWRAGLETNWLHFGDDPHHSGSRSGSGKNCHFVNTHRTYALQKSFSNSIMLVFGGGLCSLSTSSFSWWCHIQLLMLSGSSAPVSVYALHPGLVRSDFFRHQPWYRRWVISVFCWLFGKDCWHCAQTTIYCAVDENL